MEESNIKNSTKASLVRIALLIVCIVLMITASYSEARPLKELQVLQYFNLSEFTDREPPHEVKMNREFLLKLDELRRLCGFPLHVNSGYRSPNHPDEKHKDKPGTHTKGIAADIRAITNHKRKIILKHARALRFTGIGIYPLHLHIDSRKAKQVIWVCDKYTLNHSRDSPRR